MKLSIFVPITVIIVISYISVGDCNGLTSWIPKTIVDSVSNKTAYIKNYVDEKLKSVKRIYTDAENMKYKISSYFKSNGAGNKNVNQLRNLEENKQNSKFKKYISDAELSNNEIFDSIAPSDIKQSCNNDDPTIYMTTPQLIAIHGYYAESHTVITEDGYLLTLHRIPYSGRGLNKLVPHKTVLLHHGLLGSSADWVLAGPRKGLAYILSDSGYDVWLANVRGNTYSRAHITRKVNSFEFWNFTWHDVSQHDLPAAIDYIMNVKGLDVKINYIGHSMGTTALFALLSTKTQYNKVLRAGFALAPVAYMSNIKSPIKLLAKYSNDIQYLMKLLGANEFLPQNSVLRWLSKHACEVNHYEEAICENSMFILCGFDQNQFNRTLLPLILGHVPAGASTLSLVHYAQEIRNNGKFQQFDFGRDGNLKQYGMETPPQYALHKITLPIALFSAQNDWLAGEADVANLYTQLVNPIDHYIVPMKDFNHIDFLWAIDAPSLVYKHLLRLLEDGVSKSLFNIEYTKK